jgi:hypothetical protein
MSEELPIIADGKLVGRIAKTGNKLSFRQNKNAKTKRQTIFQKDLAMPALIGSYRPKAGVFVESTGGCRDFEVTATGYMRGWP